MCGICGQINFASDEPVQAEVIHRMACAINHRGPDDEGFYINGPLGLGFRRLSIIDLAGGHQPMTNQDQSVWVILNGEIYNFKELRTELRTLGYQFQTQSDTEVIVHGYREWGTNVLQRLNGMFGLAIWDAREKRLVLARDAMGIKLIYYRIAGGQLTFGSEIRAILAAQESSPTVDPTALSLFLQFRYTPSPLTIFEGIRKLAPGAMLIVEKGNCREERWYNYTPVPFSSPKEDREATEELLALYRGAVRRHLLSDVPVGILLSGGLDSGLLLGLMNENGGPWPAFTVGYGETYQEDELADAAETAAIFGARHIQIRIDQTKFEESLPAIVACLEEPIAASSIVPMYFVSERARQEVKVVLIGQGPDELFGGYNRHLGVRYGDWWRGLPGAFRSPLTSAVNHLPRNETLKRGVRSLGIKERLQRYQDVFSIAPHRTIKHLFHEEYQSNGNENRLVKYWEDLKPEMKELDELGGFQLIEIRSSLPDELLMYADKLSMAHSLEARVPYLDRTVVEYAQRLDASMKIRRGSRKWLHRQVCQSYLPPQILKRKKRGFAVNVVDSWFNSAVGGHLPEVLLNNNARMFQYLRPEPVRQLLEEHRAQRHDNHKLLFSLVMFEQWLQGMTSSRSTKRDTEAVRKRMSQSGSYSKVV